MPRSMTAFARITRDLAWGSISCELRSVNHRYFESNFRLPETLRHTETLLRELARAKLQRGKVECQIELSHNNQHTALDVDLDLAKRYISVSEGLAARMLNPAPLSALEVMRWPGVLKELEIDRQQIQSAAFDVFEAALGQLLEGRAREGNKLAATIAIRLKVMQQQVALVRRELPQILAYQRQRLNDRLAHLAAELDGERLEQEMAIIANRTDVDEELDRLEVHISEIYSVLLHDEPIGRRLDFLMQELNREANTLGAKSLSTITTGVAIELKVLIEQMREQIQNIE
ncbi:MAG: YicC family protein [Porticoccaceae bacterium]|nr:YicC family protein [Porticoccaceae bacterium]